MKLFTLPLLTAVSSLAALPVLPASAQAPASPAGSAGAPPADLSTLLRDALFEEEATRDLTKAAAGYETLLAQWAGQRPTAAAALYRLAEVRRKQDRKDDAIALYQRLLREFPDIEPHAKLARENLSALGAKEPAPASPAEALQKGIWPGDADPLITTEEAEALKKAKKLAADSPDLLSSDVIREACEKGYVELLRFVLSKRARDNPDGDGLQIAVRGGHLSIVKELTALKPPARHLAASVDAAIEENRLAVLKALLEAGASPEGDAPAFPALVTAIHGQNVEAIELLLAHKAQPDPATAETTALFTAAKIGDSALVARLLALKADPNRKSRGSSPNDRRPNDQAVTTGEACTPLAAAVASGNAEAVKLLLEAKADPNTPNALGVTPLRGAIDKNSLPITQQLLAAGANPNFSTPGGYPPLAHAIVSSRPDIAAALLKAKADPNVFFGEQNTESYFSWLSHSSQIIPDPAPWVRLLLENGADPNFIDRGGNPPLFHFLGHLPITALLLKANADPNAITGKENKVSVFAHILGAKNWTERDAFIALWLEHGADPFLPAAPPVQSADAALRIKLLRSHKYPALSAKAAVTLVFGDEIYLSPLAARKDENEKPGPLPALLTAWDEKGGWQTPNGEVFEKIPEWSTLRLWRKGADGKMQETVIEVKKDTAWPELQWGDVIEVLAIDPGKDPSANNPERRHHKGLPSETLDLLKPAK